MGESEYVLMHLCLRDKVLVLDAHRAVEMNVSKIISDLSSLK